MTDQTNAASHDLGVPGAAQPLAPPLPLMSADEALSRKSELFANAEWREKYFAGDVQAGRDYAAIVQALTPKQAAPLDSRESLVDFVRERADISEQVAEQIRTDRPVSPQEYRLAQQRKDQLLSDAGWIERYNRGERAAVTELTLVNVILASRVRDNPTQP